MTCCICKIKSEKYIDELLKKIWQGTSVALYQFSGIQIQDGGEDENTVEILLHFKLAYFRNFRKY